MKTEESQRLPENIRKNGFDYTQVRRGQRSFVFRQHATPKLDYYEVFLIKIRPAGEVFGKWQPAKERFPGNEDFGNWAWSYSTIEAAMQKYEELEQREEL